MQLATCIWIHVDGMVSICHLALHAKNNINVLATCQCEMVITNMSTSQLFRAHQNRNH